jgi:hypothetical protein
MGLAALFFLVLLLLDKEVVALVTVFKIPIFQPLVDAVSVKSAPYLIVIVFIGAVYLFFLHQEGEWNVLLMLRDVIHIWIAIPRGRGSLRVHRR